jgi:nifR3 family TIM-barrel protein
MYRDKKTDERGFWAQLKEKKPFIALAPMADVTDAPFRQIIAKYSRHGKAGGGPDVFWTEFVSADGLMSPGRAILKTDLQFSKKERPIVAQLFGKNPETMEGAAKLVAELGFDGVDINMGCPDRSVMRQGAGGAHIRDPKNAVAIIQATKRGVRAGVRAGKKPIPVSVKTRIGYSKNELATWLPLLLAEKPAVVTIHARTVKELSLVPARWEHVREAVLIRDALKSDTLIIGNGDVCSPADAFKRAQETGADGVMIGRGIFGNPWLFDTKRKCPPTLPERLSVLMEHTKLFQKLLTGRKNFAVMKKHFKAYVHGFDGAKELRAELMECDTYADMSRAIRAFLKKTL